MPESLPQQLGYRWPAEWEPHRGTWMTWPHNADTWPGIFDQIPFAYARLVRAIAEFEPVFLLVQPELVQTVWEMLGDVSALAIVELATNDSWIRDYGPFFLQSPDKRTDLVVDWAYNAWGEKYPPWDLDAAAAAAMAAGLELPRVEAPFVLEGGAVEGDGHGTILTTRSCVLHPNRNGQVEQAHVERLLTQYLTAQRVIWLEHASLNGDDTDGHVDQLVRFVNPHTVIVAATSSEDTANYNTLIQLRRELEQVRCFDGSRLEVQPIQIPQNLYLDDHRLPASYCNFSFVNGGVVLPVFEAPEDAAAIATFEQLFPDRQICPVPCRELVWGLGAVHCLTLQQPQ